MKLSAPHPLRDGHNLASFGCGESTLDEWLRRRALGNQATGASRTFVVTQNDDEVVAYYAMAAGAVSHHDATGQIRRNMPDPIPTMVLARLAVDLRFQGMQLGAALLQDAVQRAHAVAENVGVRALLVHALNEQARGFYQHYGFESSPINPMVMMLRLHAGDSH